MRKASDRCLRAFLVATVVGSFLLVTSGPAAAATNPWSSAASMAQARSRHTATLLPTGKVLVAGGFDGSGPLASAELYDPATNTWSPAASMAQSRYSHTATLLGNGKVLVAGGFGSFGALASAELYDPGTDTWSPAASMATPRYQHTATLLPDGEVLVVGGLTNGSGSQSYVASAERYDPATNTWLRGGSMPSGKYEHTATLLPDGKVLVAGGTTWTTGVTAEADLFTPPNRWSVAAPMTYRRDRHTATLLGNGQVLVAGGAGYPDPLPELYDSVANSWSPAGTMASARSRHTATLLANGRVLVAGGDVSTGLSNATEQYDPITNTWSTAGSMPAPGDLATATLLPNGQVLVAGGFVGGYSETELAYAQLYTPPVEESDLPVQLDGWVGFTDPSASWGAYRASRTAKELAKLSFPGTSVTWLSQSGPDRGMASVTIDGAPEGTFDLYAPTAGPYSQTFSGLAAATHIIVVKVLGTKNAASTNTWVPVDGFTVGSTTTQESSPLVKLGTWAGQLNTATSDGYYRISSTSGAQVTFQFTGTSIDWVTSTGRKYGQAQVTIDGGSMGTVDLYAPTAPQWQVVESYSGLSSGPHTIVVKALGTKNPSSNGTGVVVDAFVVHV